MTAEDLTRAPEGGGTIIVIKPNPNDTPKGKPRMPAKTPFDCYLHDGFVSIICQHPIQPSVQIYSYDEAVAYAVDFFGTTPQTVHYINIDPQSTNLTIEIEVDGKKYIGEFFY